MFGFLMTTYPRWMNGKEIPAQCYVPAFVLLMLGAIGFYVGLFIGHNILLAAICSTLLGWGVALYALSLIHIFETGIENGEWIAITDGIQPGAEVAVNGQFLLDSAASMSAAVERMQSHERMKPSDSLESKKHDAK